MTSYSQGEVILTEIAFSGEPGRKRRPAVIISCDEYNRSGIKFVVGAVTMITVGLCGESTTTLPSGYTPHDLR